MHAIVLYKNIFELYSILHVEHIYPTPCPNFFSLFPPPISHFYYSDSFMLTFMLSTHIQFDVSIYNGGTVHVCMSRADMDTGCLSLALSIYFLRQCFSLNLELINWLDRLARVHLEPYFCLPSTPATCHHAWLFMCEPGSECRSSCLCGRYFSIGIIFLVSLFCFLKFLMVFAVGDFVCFHLFQ